MGHQHKHVAPVYPRFRGVTAGGGIGVQRLRRHQHFFEHPVFSDTTRISNPTQEDTLDLSSLALELTLGCASLFFCRGSSRPKWRDLFE